MNDFRENYLIAREIVANELIEKYNLILSHKDEERLTIDSSNYSIHLTFIVPDGDEVYLSQKGKDWYTGKSYRKLFFENYPNQSEQSKAIKEIFTGSKRKPYSFEMEEIKFTFLAKLHFLQKILPEYFV